MKNMESVSHGEEGAPRGRNVILAGPMGCGKTTVGRRLAKALGVPFLDTDLLIEAEAERTVAEIFAREGEDGFRRRERETIARAARLNNTVIAVGGGAMMDPVNRKLLGRSGLLVGLTATAEAISERVCLNGRVENAGGGTRPLLTGEGGEDHLARIGLLLRQRLPGLAACDFTIDTSELPISECVARILRELGNRKQDAGEFGRPVSAVSPGRASGSAAALHVQPAASAEYAVVIGEGLRRESGRILRETANLPKKLLVVTNTTVQALYGGEVVESLRADGFAVSVAVLPDGEQHKTLDTAGRVFDQMAREGMSRLDTGVVALGGGVVGDLAGFVAATYGRGVPLVQMPTTLLAQVDAAVGGKVAVNHAAGKNLIGAFYHPVAVIADTQTLASLPEREYVEGLAEVVKYGVVLDEGLFRFLKNNSRLVAAREPKAVEEIVLRSCRLKAEVVREDERDKGARMALNFGHTIGHAVEAVAGYGALRHGEAVSIGMVVATKLALLRGMVSDDEAQRVQRLLREFGLPLEAPREGLGLEALLPFLALDKKAVGGRLRFILPNGLGRHVLVDDVSLEMLRAAWTACAVPDAGQAQLGSDGGAL